MSVCPQCQAQLPEGATSCPACGAAIPTTARVDLFPAIAGGFIFVVVLLSCEWLEVLWPVIVVGVTYLAFLVYKYGKLAYVAPALPAPKMEAEVPVSELLEKVEVPEPAVEKASTPEPEPAKTEAHPSGPVCPSCGEPRNGAPRFCGNCGKPFKD